MVLLGMTGFLSAFTQAPITSAVMVLETTMSLEFATPILITATIAKLISAQFGASLYEIQSDKFLK